MAGMIEQKDERNSDIFDYLNYPIILGSTFELQNRSFKTDRNIEIENNVSLIDEDEFRC
jgi:hypothetical protein